MTCDISSPYLYSVSVSSDSSGAVWWCLWEPLPADQSRPGCEARLGAPIKGRPGYVMGARRPKPKRFLFAGVRSAHSWDLLHQKWSLLESSRIWPSSLRWLFAGPLLTVACIFLSSKDQEFSPRSHTTDSPLFVGSALSWSVFKSKINEWYWKLTLLTARIKSIFL